ncbi:hypothetical protein [Kitasatospora azatica]|uniref:hypothetical protein n=1 Tax=Kitasatospora azatica TaxID=58347 RepID=UPI000561930A|nr:hypothetical protein [Kitasatospora azatica]
MYLITLRLTGPDTASVDPDCLTALIESLIEPADGVEHLRVLCRPGRIDLAVFVLAGSAGAAGRAAHALCRRVVAEPPLADWRPTANQ